MELENLNEQLAMYMEKVRELEIENHRLEEENIFLKKKNELEKECSESNDPLQLSSGIKKKTDWEGQCSKLEKKVDRMKSQIKELADANLRWSEYGRVSEQLQQQKIREQQEMTILKQQIVLYKEDFARERRDREEAQEEIQKLKTQIVLYKEDFARERRDREEAQEEIQKLKTQIRKYVKNCKHDPTLYEGARKLLYCFQGSDDHVMNESYPVEETDGGQHQPSTGPNTTVPPCTALAEMRISPDLLAMKHTGIFISTESGDIKDTITTRTLESDPDTIADKAFEARLIDEDDLDAVMEKKSLEEKRAVLLDILDKKEPGTWEQEYLTLINDVQAVAQS